MVYPNQVIQNDNWTDSAGVGILLALGEGDGMYIYHTSPINLLHLGMPQEVVNCEVSVRADGMYPPLDLQFFLAGNFVDSVSVPTTNNWVTHTLTVDRWDSVLLSVGVGGTVGVDFLRAVAADALPTRRTLTGVGI
jgi:hypothetical protein